MESTSMAIKAPLWTRDFILLIVSNMFLFIGFQMLVPTIPVYAAELGAGNAMVGLVIGIFTVSGVLVRSLSGVALESLGKKLFLILGVVICLLASGGYFWMTSIVMIMGMRLLHGLGWGISTTTYGTIASDLVPASRRGEGLGYFGVGATIGMSLGPFVGIWLMNRYGFGYVFAFSALSGLLSLFLSLRISPPKIKIEANSNEEQAEPLFFKLVEKKALFPSFLALLLGITYGGIITFITLYGQEVGIENVGWFFLINALFVFLIRPFAGMLFDKKGHKWVLLPGGFFAIAGLILLSLASTTLILILSAIFYGIAFGAIQPSLQAWIVNRVQPHRRGAANATFFSAFDLGIASGAMLFGLLTNLISYSMMYLYSSLFILVYLVVYSVYLLRIEHDHK